MKKFIILVLIIAIFIAFYEQNSPKPNVIITIICMAIFMFGLMKLSAKIPPKDKDDEHKII
jgi:membrane protein insertase Oxa1/YidC/SpoIIIJ